MFWREKGLVLDLQFAERSGTVAYDQSGNGNHGTIYGASWRRGPLLGALYFDGVDDHVVVPNDSSLNVGPELSIEAIVRPCKRGRGQVIYDNTWSAVNGWQLMVDVVLTGFVFNANDGNTNHYYAWDFPETCVYYHVVATVKAYDRVRIYVNGLKRVDKDYPYDFPGTPDRDHYIGSNRFGSNVINGGIALVRVYNRVLGEEEVRAHYRYLMGSVQRVRRRLRVGVA